MFRTACSNFVKTVCGHDPSASGLGLGQSIVAAGSLNEASQVNLGTFVIKTHPVHFWQDEASHFFVHARVKVDSSDGTEEVIVVNDIKKEIDLDEKDSFNLSALKEIGVNVGVDYTYKMQANFGQVKRIDLKKDSITDFVVPSDVAKEMAKTEGGMRTLAIVTKVFTVPNESTISFKKELKFKGKVNAKVASTDDGDQDTTGKEQLTCLTMVAGQNVAYCIQDCKYDLKSKKFMWPEQDEEDPEKESAGGGGDDNGGEKSEEATES